jgi:hypothetical protein
MKSPTGRLGPLVLVLLSQGAACSGDGLYDTGTGTPVGIEEPADTTTPPPQATVPLAVLVNEYRQSQGLDPIPLSASLHQVAEVHVQDLEVNEPQGGVCNLHSWSSAGSWTACCYTADHAQAQCMWDKPRELTSYPGNGYENAAGGGSGMTPERALEAWKGSPAHHAVILNQRTWTRPWQALGAAVSDHYAVLWFGHEVDPAGPPPP